MAMEDGKDAGDLANLLQRMGLHGEKEMAAVGAFMSMATAMQEQNYDVGLLQDRNYVVPATISAGTVRHLRDAADNKVDELKKIARTLISEVERMADALRAAQLAEFKARIAAMKYDQYTASVAALAAERAADRRKQQALANGLTAFAMPKMEDLKANKRMRPNGQRPNGQRPGENVRQPGRDEPNLPP